MSTSQRTHNGGLYCSEGSTHVNRPSVRVRQPPGGGQTGGWMNGYQEDPKTEAKRDDYNVKTIPPKDNIPNRNLLSNDVIVGGSQDQAPVQKHSARTNRSNESSFSLAHEENQTGHQGEYNAMYCTEGNQVRNRPSVRVHGEKQRDYNILHFQS